MSAVKQGRSLTPPEGAGPRGLRRWQLLTGRKISKATLVEKYLEGRLDFDRTERLASRMRRDPNWAAS